MNQHSNLVQIPLRCQFRTIRVLNFDFKISDVTMRNFLESYSQPFLMWNLLTFRLSKLEWTTRQNICIMLHILWSKFHVYNDARNENFRKRLLSEILTFLMSIYSNVPLINKPNSTCVKSRTEHCLQLQKASKHSKYLFIAVLTIKITRAQHKKLELMTKTTPLD